MTQQHGWRNPLPFGAVVGVVAFVVYVALRALFDGANPITDDLLILDGAINGTVIGCLAVVKRRLDIE